MDNVKVRLDRQNVKTAILLNPDVEDFLVEVAEDIMSNVNESGSDEPLDLKIERVPNRRNRVAVDLTANRTKDLVEKHLLEKGLG